LRLRKSEVIQDEIEGIFLCLQYCTLEKFQERKKYKAECHLHISDVSEANLVALDDDCGSQVG